RITVAGEQRALEEAERDCPYGWRAAEHGQHHLGEHWLDRKQEQRRHEGRQRKEPENARPGRAGCISDARRGGWTFGGLGTTRRAPLILHRHQLQMSAARTALMAWPAPHFS